MTASIKNCIVSMCCRPLETAVKKWASTYGLPYTFGRLVDIEYSNRKSNSLKRLIRNAGFDQPDAYIGDVNYTSGAS